MLRRLAKERQAALDGAQKVGFLAANHVLNALGINQQFRVCLSHVLHQRGHQLEEERLALVEALVAEAEGAT